MKKMPTLFERVYENHRIVDILPNVTKGMEWVLEGDGVATVKIDGACCFINDGRFYRRYDAKNGKPVPLGAIKCQREADPITGHLPCWVAVDENKPSDKWFVAAYNHSCKNGELEDGTYEAVGPHFQGNPYNYDEDMLVRHGEEIVEVERTFDGIKKYLEENYIEGLVFYDRNGNPACKIKRSDFGFEWNGR